MAVFSGLGGGHLHDLAGSSLQHHEAVLAQGRALLGEGGGCPGIACLEVDVCVCHTCSRTHDVTAGRGKGGYGERLTRTKNWLMTPLVMTSLVMTPLRYCRVRGLGEGGPITPSGLLTSNSILIHVSYGLCLGN